jgi:hypothetical protein
LSIETQKQDDSSKKKQGKDEKQEAGKRRSLRGNRINYQKLCQSKTFSGYQCH